MLTLLSPLLSRFVGGVVLAAAIVVGYSFWAMHERNLGYASCKTDMLKVATEHQNKVDETVNHVDSTINKLSDPMGQLQQFWSEQ
jgi:hypothetical protein